MWIQAKKRRDEFQARTIRQLEIHKCEFGRILDGQRSRLLRAEGYLHLESSGGKRTRERLAQGSVIVHKQEGRPIAIAYTSHRCCPSSCNAALGSTIRAHVPRLCALSHVSVPPRRRIARAASTKPRPAPLPGCLVVKNVRPSLVRSPGLTPGPRSV